MLMLKSQTAVGTKEPVVAEGSLLYDHNLTAEIVCIDADHGPRLMKSSPKIHL